MFCDNQLMYVIIRQIDTIPSESDQATGKIVRQSGLFSLGTTMGLRER